MALTSVLTTPTTPIANDYEPGITSTALPPAPTSTPAIPIASSGVLGAVSSIFDILPPGTQTAISTAPTAAQTAVTNTIITPLATAISGVGTSISSAINSALKGDVASVNSGINGAISGAESALQPLAIYAGLVLLVIVSLVVLMVPSGGSGVGQKIVEHVAATAAE